MDLCGLEKWASRSLIKFNKCEVLTLGRSKPRHRHRLRATHLESILSENVLVDTKLTMRTGSQGCPVLHQEE